MNSLQSKLSCKIVEPEISSSIANNYRAVFGEDIGKFPRYQIYASIKGPESWTENRIFKYDTGSTLTLVPKNYFNLLSPEKFSEGEVHGIFREKPLSVKIIKTNIILTDNKGIISPKIEARVAIGNRNDIPLLLGMKDLANSHIFKVDPYKKKFYLSFTESKAN